MRLQHRNVVPVANPPDKPQINNLPHTPVSERRVGFALAAVAAMTVFSGIWEGRINHRWGAPPATLAAAKQLAAIPGDFGNWRLQSSGVLDKSAVDQLQCAGQVVRTYVQKRTGEQVAVVLIVGPAGPTSAHRPEICLSSRNYVMRGDRRLFVVSGPDGTTDQFWSLDFQSTSVGGELLRVCYAWSVGEGWTAPNDARFAFAGSPYLYKIQVSTLLHAGKKAQEDAKLSQFLRDFAAAARSHIVAPRRT